MHTTFSYREALRFGSAATKQHFFPLVGIIILLFLLQVIVGLSVDDNKVLELIAQIFIAPGFALAALSVFFRVVDGHNPEFSHLTERSSHYFRFVGTNVLYGLAVLVGFILLIIPGIYVATRLMYALTIVAEKNLKPMEAFRMSSILTRGLILQLIGFQLVLVLVNICGALLLGVGLLFTVPMTSLALLFVYKKLSLERLTQPSLVEPPAQQHG